jgi:hypothetical protein
VPPEKTVSPIWARTDWECSVGRTFSTRARKVIPRNIVVEIAAMIVSVVAAFFALGRWKA